eukprot:COSAG01_NODE_3355_length_6214_cov_2.843009_3_plen_47_part_00
MQQTDVNVTLQILGMGTQQLLDSFKSTEPNFWPEMRKLLQTQQSSY